MVLFFTNLDQLLLQKGIWIFCFSKSVKQCLILLVLCQQFFYLFKTLFFCFSFSLRTADFKATLFDLNVKILLSWMWFIIIFFFRLWNLRYFWKRYMSWLLCCLILIGTNQRTTYRKHVLVGKRCLRFNIQVLLLYV